jgi:hypothetical protein
MSIGVHLFVRFFFGFFVTEEILRIMAQLQSRKFGQAHILLQALSSHPHIFIMFLCESMNFHSNKKKFQVAGVEPLTLGL